ncbi:MAG: DUF1641 domain-containing protein [Desulfobacteraceae bacterium]|nr:DUF1641 domain-containing protein [Desulfobacteraceae bacterium]
MTNEEKILERLERLEQKITPIAESAASIKELKEELAPRVNEAVQALIVEMADVEADFQIENLLYLLKKAMRNVKNFSFALDMMHSGIDLAVNAEPLLKSTVPQIINFLDDLEQKNIFKFINISLDVLKSITQKYSVEEIEQIGHGLGKLVDTLKHLTDPKAVELIEKASKIPSTINLEESKSTGPVSMLMAMNDKDIKKGLGVLMELTKGLATLKSDNN